MKNTGRSPFYAGTFDGRDLQHIAAEDRLQCVREMNAATLRRVLEYPGVQKTVVKAAAARLRRLEGRCRRGFIR